MICKVEGYSEEADEYWEEECLKFDDEEYIVIDDGVDMVTFWPHIIVPSTRKVSLLDLEGA